MDGSMQESDERERGSTAEFVAGIELGGTRCVCTLAGAPDRIADQRILATGPPEQTLAAIATILAGWWRAHGFAALGIASFGPVDLDPASPAFGSILVSPKPGWQGADVARRLGRPFPVPTVFDTDVNGAAAAEMAWGAGRGLRDFAYVTVGTGVGVGLIVDGRPLRGFGHCELGHVRIARQPGDDWPGACPFHGDCVEGLASGPAIATRLGGADPAALPPDHPVWESVGHALGQLCHVIVCAAAPRRIAVGGGVANGQPHLLPRIEQRLMQSLAGYREPPGERPYVTAPGLGAAAGPLGPIALALSAGRPPPAAGRNRPSG
jgi:fructokinase